MQNQPLNEQQLQALLRLKRHEAPPAGYFENLLDRVHRRQREEALRRPAWRIALDRVRAFFAPLHVEWRHAAAAAALLIVGVAAIRVAIPERAAVHLQFAQAAVPEAALPTKLTLGSAPVQQPATVENRHIQRDPNAPVRFIIDAQPVSYETTQIRF